METSQKSLVRVMIDTNVLVAGVVWPRWPFEVIHHAVKGDYSLVLSDSLVDEARRRISETFPEYVDALEVALGDTHYEPVEKPSEEDVVANQSLMRDITDVPIALAAINAQVDCFITHDRDFTERTPENEELHRRLNILLPAVFLREYMGWTSEALEAIRTRTWDQV